MGPYPLFTADDESRVTTNRNCVKCGHIYNEIKYDPVQDNLMLTCARCGYSWRKEPLDKKRSDDEV